MGEMQDPMSRELSKAVRSGMRVHPTCLELHSVEKPHLKITAICNEMLGPESWEEATGEVEASLR